MQIHVSKKWLSSQKKYLKTETDDRRDTSSRLRITVPSSSLGTKNNLVQTIVSSLSRAERGALDEAAGATVCNMTSLCIQDVNAGMKASHFVYIHQLYMDMCTYSEI